MIAVALHSSFNAGIRVWRRAEENMRLHQTIRLALEGVAIELRNAIFYEGEAISETGTPPEETGFFEKPDLAFIGSKEEIIFISLINKLTEAGDPRKELARVRYALEDGTKLSRSVAFQGEGFAEPVSSGSLSVFASESGKEILIEDIEELRFEYSYEGEEESSPVWKDSWEDQQGLPLGVKAHLKVKRKEGTAGDFSKTVFIPTGILGKEEELIETNPAKNE